MIATQTARASTLPAVCAHPYIRAIRYGAQQLVEWACFDCSQPRPAPGTVTETPDCDCGFCVDAGHAGLALVLPVGLFGGGMIALAAASGKLGYLLDHLPIVATGNGLTLLALAAIAAGCWWAMRHAETTAHESLELGAWFGTAVATPAPSPEPTPQPPPVGHVRHRLDPSTAGRFWLDDPGVGPWFGPYPDDAYPTLLPDPDGRVRS